MKKGRPFYEKGLTFLPEKVDLFVENRLPFCRKW